MTADDQAARTAKVRVDLRMDEPLAPDWGGEQDEHGNNIYHHAWDSTCGELRLYVGPYAGAEEWAVMVSHESLDVVLRCSADEVLEWADNVKAAIVSYRADRDYEAARRGY